MQPKTRKRVWLIGVPLVVVAGTAGFIWGGVYNVAADDMHTKPVHFLLETARERSILARAGRLDVPPAWTIQRESCRARATTQRCAPGATWPRRWPKPS